MFEDILVVETYHAASTGKQR